MVKVSVPAKHWELTGDNGESWYAVDGVLEIPEELYKRISSDPDYTKL
jgi:hypothetical protein